MGSEQAATLSGAHEFIEERLRPSAASFDANQQLPQEVVRELGEVGILGAALPSSWGGGGLDAVSYGELTCQVGRACSSSRALMTVHACLAGDSILTFGTDDQKERWLPDLAAGRAIFCFALSEPGVGSDAGSVETRYVRQGDSYRITGTKRWISFAEIADVILVVAAGEPGISVFAVDSSTPGVSITPVSGMIGQRASHVAEVDFDQVAVPAANRLGPEGAGLSFVVNNALSFGRYSVAWGAVALAEEALAIMSTYANTRIQFGEVLGNHQLIKAIIGDAWVSTAAARALAAKAGESRNAKHPDAAMDAAVAKQFAAVSLRKVASDAVQVLGGMGCWSGAPAERIYREAKILEIIEGSTQIQQLVIGDYAMSRTPIAVGVADLAAADSNHFGSSRPTPVQTADG